jgi:hypothetical protein
MLTSATASQGWSFSSDETVDAAAISSEIAHVGTETLIFSRAFDFIDQAGRETRAIRFDELTWEAAGPVISETKPFWQEWSLVEGALGPCPPSGIGPRLPCIPPGWEVLLGEHRGDDSGWGGCATCRRTGSPASSARALSWSPANTMRLWVGNRGRAPTSPSSTDKGSRAYQYGTASTCWQARVGSDRFCRTVTSDRRRDSEARERRPTEGSDPTVSILEPIRGVVSGRDERKPGPPDLTPAVERFRLDAEVKRRLVASAIGSRLLRRNRRDNRRRLPAPAHF